MALGSSKKELALFYDKLGELHRAGVPLDEGLVLASSGLVSADLRAAARGVTEAVARGKSLADGFARAKGAISDVDVALIRVGETEGRLDETFARLSALHTTGHRDQMKVLLALIYPAFLLGSAVLLPPLGTWFRDGLGAYLGTVARTTLLLLGPFAGLGLLYWLAATYFPSGFDRFKLEVPIVGTTLRKLAAARFNRSLALLIDAGVDLRTSLQLAGSSLGNRYLQDRFRGAARVLDRGGSLAEALAVTNVFPLDGLHFVAVGERSGELPKMLSKAAETHEHEARQVITAILAAIPVLLYLMVAVYIGYTVVSFYTNSFKLP